MSLKVFTGYRCWLALAALALICEGTALGAPSKYGAVKAPRTGVETAHPAAARAKTFYDKGMVEVKAARYHQAGEAFLKANELMPDNPDILNMVAFCYRKVGSLDEAFIYYQRALDLRPAFPQAREYLGEAHLQAALEQLKILRGYGTHGQKEAAQLEQALKRAASSLNKAKAAPAKRGP